MLAHCLLSPIPLAFALGFAAKALGSELTVPQKAQATLSVYLLFALGLRGGVELADTPLAAIALPSAVTLVIGVLTPLCAYVLARRLGGYSQVDAAGIAAHYGSVSAVTFVVAQQFVEAAGCPAEGFMPTLLTLLESPGIHVALALGTLGAPRVRPAVWAAESHAVDLQPALVGLASPLHAPAFVTQDFLATRGSSGALHAGAGRPSGILTRVRASQWPRGAAHSLRKLLTSQTMVLLVGGLLIGWASGAEGYAQVKPFFDGGFKGALTLFLLGMGLTAGERIGELRKSGAFLLAFGLTVPVLHGVVGVALGHWAGLSVGGATVLGAMAASASYIAGPAAVRMSLPEANPSVPLALALGITFPFNLVFGIPLFFMIARALGAP